MDESQRGLALRVPGLILAPCRWARPLQVFVVCLLVSSFLLAGCSPQWKAKFIRKKKNVAPPPAILVLEPDYRAILPPHSRYQEHFAFWKTWHGSLLDSYGQLRKRDKANLNGVIGEVEAMRALLTGEPGGRLQNILEELQGIQEQWDRMPGSWIPPHSTRFRLEQLSREINKKYFYAKVKGSIRPDPEPSK